MPDPHPPQPERGASYFSPAPPRVLAHRGLARSVPENSLAAFAAALEVGATHIETDAVASADGVAVLWHDPTLARFDGSEVKVDSLTWGALQRRVSSLDERSTLTTLADALDAFPAARFNIDVKTAAAVVPVAEAVLAAGAAERVLLTSFAESRARAVWRAVPAAARSATRERMIAALLAVELGSERLLARALSGIDALQIPERAGGLTLTHPKRLAAFRRHVREVHVWTVNEAIDMRRLWDGGIDGIVTDRADIAMRVRGELGSSA